MEIQDFLAQTSQRVIPLAELTAIAADRRAFGDDVHAAFRTQIEQRANAASKVLQDAETAGRDTLLASEQRSYDTAIRERDSILSLQQAVERRTEQRNHVPATQTTSTEQRAEDLSAVLGKEQRCADWVRARGGRYVGENGADKMRFGAVLRALALGDRRDLSDLEQRALSEGTDAAGGYTVPEVLGSGFIDRVRNAMVTMRAGAVTVPMTSDTLHLARLASADAPAWKAENTAITEAAVTLERLTFTARTLPMLIRLSVELSEDSANIDAIIERELAQAIAGELDRAALRGSGTAPEPRGIRNQTGVTVQGPLGGANGSTPADYDFLLDAGFAVAAANFDVGALARIYHSRTAKVLAKLKDTTTQPLALPAHVAKWPEFVTNAIPITLTAGTSTDCSEAYVGDFRELLIGLRTSFRLEVSRVEKDSFEKLQIAVRAYLRADVQLAHAAAFTVVTGIRG